MERGSRTVTRRRRLTYGEATFLHIERTDGVMGAGGLPAGRRAPRYGVTVRLVVPVTVVDVAAMIVVPAATAVASPSLPAALLMVATAVADEVHVTSAVMFCVVASE